MNQLREFLPTLTKKTSWKLLHKSLKISSPQLAWCQQGVVDRKKEDSHEEDLQQVEIKIYKFLSKKQKFQ